MESVYANRKDVQPPSSPICDRRGRDLCGDKDVLFVTAGGPNCNPAAVPSCDASHCTRNVDPAPDCDPDTNCCAASAEAIDCLDDQSVVDQIRALGGAGVRTMVASLSSSDLNVSFYAIGESAGADALASTFHDITINLVKNCVIPFDTPPQDPELVSVLVDCQWIPRDPTDGGDGSYWTLDLGARTITLGGPACDQLIHPGVNRVDYVFGCPRS